MPTYEYECLCCGEKFDVFQKMTEEHLRECRKCRGKVRRLVGTGAGVLYRGGGFYTTEYRSESYKREAQAEKTAGSVAPACPAAGACQEKKCTA
jgi:putative FmdB family regulatory protein